MTQHRRLVAAGAAGTTIIRIGLAFVLLIAVAGCAATKSYSSLDADGGGMALKAQRVLLMTPDIELSELTAAGLKEPKAGWTLAARANVETALIDFFAGRNMKLVRYRPPTEDPDRKRGDDQLIKLHQRVGGSILLHLYNSPNSLPGKKDRLDWTLGPGAASLGREQGADHGLFIYIRDSYASRGRITTIAVMALFGVVGVSGGTQVGFASLVDLETGKVVWFSRLISGTGDLRTPAPAAKAIRRLLTDFPA